MTDSKGTAIVPYKVQPPAALLPTSDELAMIKAIAGAALEGKSLLPTISERGTERPMTPGEASVIMLFGRELGVQPMAALSQIYVVKGRPSASAQLLVGLMQSRDPNAWVEILQRTAEVAKVCIHYKGRSQVFEATIGDAKRAGLAEGVNWKKYPKQMLVWTATRTGVRIMAPDAINALHQLPTIEQAGEMFEATPAFDVEGTAVEVAAADAEPSLTPEGEADIEAEAQAPATPAEIIETIAALVEEEPVPVNAKRQAREAFDAWCAENKLSPLHVANYLRIKSDCEDPLQRYWIEPAENGGISAVEAISLAQELLEAVNHEYKRGRAAGVSPDQAIREAMAAVNPKARLDHMIASLAEAPMPTAEQDAAREQEAEVGGA